MSTRVKNRIGTSDQRCGTCPSWLRHWENGTGEKKHVCGTIGCNNSAEVGGHVIKVGGYDRATYIVPICFSCNVRSDEYDVIWTLHPTSVSYTCGA